MKKLKVRSLLKPNRSGGVDGLRAEHFKYGSEHLKLWLMKIFNCFLILEDVPQCMKDGLVIPVHKGQGKNLLQVNSYRGITLSPVLSKIFEIVLLQRLSPLQDSGSPDILQTVYQRGYPAWMLFLPPRKPYLLTTVRVVTLTYVYLTSKRHLIQLNYQFFYTVCLILESMEDAGD